MRARLMTDVSVGRIEKDPEDGTPIAPKPNPRWVRVRRLMTMPVHVVWKFLKWWWARCKRLLR